MFKVVLMKNSTSFLSLPLNVLFALIITFASFQPTVSHAQQSIFDTSSSSLFSNDDEFLKVDQAFVFNFDLDKNQLHVNFDISEGYYLYRHQFKFTGENVQFKETHA